MTDRAVARARVLRALLIVPLFTLLVTLGMWHVERLSRAAAAVALPLLLLPWLALLPGLWRQRTRALRIGILLLAPYLAYAVMERIANVGARGYATVVLIASLLLFLALVTTLRMQRPPA